MSDVLKFRSQAELEEEAAAWVWRLDDEALSPARRAEFEQWLRRDPRHRRAVEELGGIWRSLDELAEAKRDEKVATFMAEERRLYATKPVPTHGQLRRWLPWALAASLLLVAGGLSWYRRGNASETLATAVGQQRSATLADGSVVQLNTNTILETRFTPGRRVIRLEKGEASFKVAHNAKRPFYVHAGDTVVRAVGTAFDVRLRDAHDVEVIVTEGVVEVTPRHAPARTVTATSPAPAPVLQRKVAAGERFDAGAAIPVQRITAAAASNTLAWHEGAIVFDGEPLAQAIDELNRYTDTRLVVADASIQDLRVGGRFRTGDVNGFLEALTKAFPVTIRRTSDHMVYIYARTPVHPARR
jgi:transmembrane sensor